MSYVKNASYINNMSYVKLYELRHELCKLDLKLNPREKKQFKDLILGKLS